MADGGVEAGGRRSISVEGEPIWEYPRQPFWMRPLNAAGAAIGRAGVRWPRLDPDRMMDEARRRTGLDDWGDAGFRTGLERLVAAFEEQGTAHTFGRFFFKETCIRTLANRLKIEHEFRQHPEILDVPIRRPLIVTGLPRSGTTFLHRLLSENPAGRTLLFWETLEPAPSPRPENYHTDPRIARAHRAIGTVNRLAPRIAAAHEFDAESPEECNNLFAHAFKAGFLGFMFDVPGYVEWLGEQDLDDSYLYTRKQLQLLARHIPGDPWILKAPAHLFGLQSLLAAFPDACIVQIHRDPLQAIPSVTSLCAALRGILADRVDLRRMAAELNEAMAVGIDRAIVARAQADPARFFDIRYSSLIADPVGTALSVYQHFGYRHEADFQARMRRWLAENPQHKHGVHRYSLEQFGLSPEAVNSRFAAYRAWMAEHLKQAA